LGPSSSTLLASGAPPSPLRRPRGFPRRADFRDVSSERSSRGVGFLSRVRRVFAARVPSPPRPPKRAGAFGLARDPPLLGFFFPRTQLRRVPPTPPRQLSRRCGGRGLAEPSPVPSSGFLPLSTVLAANADRIAPLARHAVFRDAPKLRGLVPCRSRPWKCPPELSPLEEPYPLSRAFCFLVGSRSTAAGATTPEHERCFPPGADPLPRLARRLRRTHGPGIRVSRTAGIGPSCAPECADRSHSRSKTVGLAGKRPARPLRSFAPLVSPFSRRPPPWPG